MPWLHKSLTSGEAGMWEVFVLFFFTFSVSLTLVGNKFRKQGSLIRSFTDCFFSISLLASVIFYVFLWSFLTISLPFLSAHFPFLVSVSALHFSFPRRGRGALSVVRHSSIDSSIQQSVQRVCFRPGVVMDIRATWVVCLLFLKDVIQMSSVKSSLGFSSNTAGLRPQ